MSTPILYFHGGPGMNCEGERALLGSLFGDGNAIEFWEEPSSNRPGGTPFDADKAFTGLVESVRRKMRAVHQSRGRFHAIAHSFSAIAVSRVLLEEPGLAAQLTLVTPTLDFKREIKRMLGLAASDFGKLDLAKEEKLRALTQASRQFFDEPMQAALALAGEDAGLFKHYWRDFDVMGRFFGAWQSKGVAMDLQAFFCVLKEYAEVVDRPATGALLQIPTSVIFGKHDPISDMDQELALCRKWAGRLQAHVFEESAHYPHLEESGRFLATIGSGGSLGFTAVDHELVEEENDVRTP